ncbi:MAG: hypothetical protein ACP6IY_11260 [Promethearchaeia archaeon]
MDTSSDFLAPEFLNIIFFEQKNLIIFPYVDLKYIKALELFTVGYNIVDLDSTSLSNLKEIIEFEISNSYSQTPSLYFIINANAKTILDLLKIEELRCIINSNENLIKKIPGKYLEPKDNYFIFYNKKNKRFLNYEVIPDNLEFEREIISTSNNEAMLLDKIQKIKIAATRIFTDLVEKGDLDNIAEILIDYEPKYWNKILKFTKLYYKINIPKISPKLIDNCKNDRIKNKNICLSESNQKYLNEYEYIISINPRIANEFIRLLHNVNINTKNLELEELYNPLKLYIYLRNHHWKDGIPKRFILDWIKMKNTNYSLTDNDLNDFDEIFAKLGISNEIIDKLFSMSFEENLGSKKKKELEFTPELSNISNNLLEIIQNDFSLFRKKVLELLSNIENNLEN